MTGDTQDQRLTDADDPRVVAQVAARHEVVVLAARCPGEGPTDADDREALALAICGGSWDEETENWRDAYRGMADAVLAAGFRREGPTNNGLRAAIEDVLAQHRPLRGISGCMGSCSWRGPDDNGCGDAFERAHEAHVSAEIALAVMAEHAPTEGPTTCECPPCPGRGNDGHGLTHCAECCYGTGVEAEPGCPVHYPLPTEGPTRQAAVIVCETPDGCTCGAPGTTPRGMHHDDCAIRADRLAATPEDGA